MNSIFVEFGYEHIFRHSTDPENLHSQDKGRPCKKDVNLVLWIARVDPRGSRLKLRN